MLTRTKKSTALLLGLLLSSVAVAETPKTDAPKQNDDQNKTTESKLPVVNKDVIKGLSDEIKGKIKQQWADITDDDLLKVEGSLQELHGILQRKYGLEKDAAQKQVDKFLKDNNIEPKK